MNMAPSNRAGKDVQTIDWVNEDLSSLRVKFEQKTDDELICILTSCLRILPPVLSFNEYTSLIEIMTQRSLID